VIYHLAAETGVGQSQYEIERYVSTNTLGTAIVLQQAAQAGNVKQVIITSSRAVYGEGLHNCSECGKDYVPPPRRQEALDAGRWEIFCPDCGNVAHAQLMNENHPPLPTSLYGLTKLQQEELALQIGQTYQLPTTVLRLFNVYGPGQSLTNPYVGVLGTFFRRIIGGNGIDIYEDGQMRRDFVYVGDVVEALRLSLNNPATFNQTINVGTGEVVTLQEAGEEVFSVLGVKPEMSFSGKYRLGDIHHAVAETKIIKEKLDYCPQISFAEGLKKYLAWASENEQDFQNIDSLAEQQLAEKNLLRQANNG
jgi:dTDP-L-rhamnose 4-epimerase